MKRLSNFMLIVNFAAVTIAIVFSTLTFTNIMDIASSSVRVWIIILPQFLVILFVTSYIFFSVYNRRKNPPQYNVAIVGFPKSGKTTLIVSLFGEAFSGRIVKYRFTPRGNSTIERVNTYLSLLQNGRAVGPTKDQDRFSFRADITIGSGFFHRVIKAEFGDFPGDDSREYARKHGPWLHTTEFFKWVIESDAIIFVVDLGMYLKRAELRKRFITATTKALRAAWFNFLDANKHREKSVKNHPVVLVFSKTDLYGVKKGSVDWNSFEEEIVKLGFGKNIPKIQDIDVESFKNGKERTYREFSEIIEFFRMEVPRFRVLFTSCYGMIDGRLMGISDLLNFILS